MFLIQVQWSLAPSLDRDAVLTRIRQLVSDARATARIVFEQTAFAVDADDNEDPTQPFTDLTIEAADAAEFWAALQAMLSDPDIGSGLRQSTDILCDAPERKREAVSAAQPRLHHFDPSEPIDEFR
jgi:hypothetical protein